MMRIACIQLTFCDNECEVTNTTLFCRDTENSLEVDWEVIKEDEESATETEIISRVFLSLRTCKLTRS